MSISSEGNKLKISEESWEDGEHKSSKITVEQLEGLK